MIVLSEDIPTQIKQYCEISTIANNFIENELYLLDTPKENITNDYLLNMVITLTFNELKDLGVELNVDFDILLFDGYRVDLIYHLRNNLNSTNLLNTFKVLDTDILNYISVCMTSDEQDKYYNFFRTLSESLPLNDSWLFIFDNLDYFEFNRNLDLHILAILDKLHLTTSEIEVDESYHLKMISEISNKQTSILRLAQQLFKTVSVKQTWINLQILNIDKDLLSPETLNLLYTADESSKQSILNTHYQNSEYRFEYYIVNNITNPSLEQMFLLVVANYDPTLTFSKYKDKFNLMVGDLFTDMAFIYTLIDTLQKG